MLKTGIAATELMFLIGCLVFAFRVGGIAERRAVLWWSGNCAAVTLLVAFGFDSPTLHLVIDGICAIGFLPLAIIYVSWWAGAVALLSAIYFSLEAAYLLAEQKIDIFYALANNSITLSIAVVFLVSGLVNMRANRTVLRGHPGEMAVGHV